ncbi:MAG: hypothetical protein WDN03_14210 [Rhizomicrobium sp.]
MNYVTRANVAVVTGALLGFGIAVPGALTRPFPTVGDRFGFWVAESLVYAVCIGIAAYALMALHGIYFGAPTKSRQLTLARSASVLLLAIAIVGAIACLITVVLTDTTKSNLAPNMAAVTPAPKHLTPQTPLVPRIPYDSPMGITAGVQWTVDENSRRCNLDGKNGWLTTQAGVFHCIYDGYVDALPPNYSSVRDLIEESVDASYVVAAKYDQHTISAAEATLELAQIRVRYNSEVQARAIALAQSQNQAALTDAQIAAEDAALAPPAVQTHCSRSPLDGSVDCSSW